MIYIREMASEPRSDHPKASKSMAEENPTCFSSMASFGITDHDSSDYFVLKR